MGSGVDWNPEFVRAGGLRLRVGRHGAGRPLLLITGIGANLDMWAPFARLVGDRELIAFDPPGAGLSQRPRRPLGMRGLAGVVRELLDALGLERVDVLGYSFGGALAQELAHRAPDRVRLLVLSLPHVAGGRTAREPGLLGEQATARLARPPDALGYAYQLYAVAGRSSLPRLHRVEHPRLIVAGEEDPSVPLGNGRLLASRLPNARLHVVKGGGHLFLLDEPQNVVGAISAFLD